MAENTKYQIVSGLVDDNGEIVEAPAWSDIAYMQKLVDEVWARIPGEDGDNQLTHENAEIVWDLRAEDLRWARCAPPEDPEYVVMRVNLPANAPEAVEIIGTFDDWAGTAMEKLDNGWYFVELEAKPSQFFKFRGAGSWDHEIEAWRSDNDEWTTIGDNELVFSKLWVDSSYKGTDCKEIELDMSDRCSDREGSQSCC